MRGSTWAVGGMLAAVMAVGGLANTIDNSHLASGWHTVVRGELGADSTVGNYRVHVHGAISSTQLEDRDLVTSPGAFVVVDLSYATTDAWDTPESVVLIDAEGREFSEPSGFGSDGRAWPTGPDIWTRGTLLFEVPADTVGDLTLEFRPELTDVRLPGAVLQVPLSVTTGTEPVALARATVLAEGER